MLAVLVVAGTAPASAGVGAGAGAACPAAVPQLCFVKHDEIAEIPAASFASCCAECKAREHCAVFTLRGATCHLRAGWEGSEPVAGPCATAALRGPTPTLPPGNATATVVVDTANATHPLRIETGRDQLLGCHTDLGYSHQIQGFYAQRVYGESFENYTANLNPAGCNSPAGCEMWANEGGGAHGLTADAPLHGLVSKRIVAAAGAGGAASVVNRGFNREGMSLAAGRPYEGYFFVRTLDGRPARLTVSLEAQYLTPPAEAPAPTAAAPRELAAVELDFPGGPGWTRLNFTLTPTASTACKPYPAQTPPLNCKLGDPVVKGNAGHVCLQCEGQLRISSGAPGVAVDLDYVFLQPGQWGRFEGLPLNLDAVRWLQAAG